MLPVDRTKKIFIVILIAAFLFIVSGFAWGGPAISEAVKANETAYTYNIEAQIVSILGMNQTWKSEDPFKYIVTIKIDESAEPVTLSPDVQHVLPHLGPGLHSVSIPDSDIAGYIDWIGSSESVRNPLNSAGAEIFSYELHEWAFEQVITLTCHEELGSSGQAELVCSEF